MSRCAGNTGDNVTFLIRQMKEVAILVPLSYTSQSGYLPRAQNQGHHTIPLSAEPVCPSGKAAALAARGIRVQQLCESRGGRPGLSVLTSLMVSVDVKQY